MKTQSLKKKLMFQRRKLIAYFFCINAHEKQQGTLYRSLEGNLTKIVEVRRLFR